MAFYLAIDLGTTGCRSIVFDDSLKEISSSYEEYGLITPYKGAAEQCANQWWDMTLRTAKDTIIKSNVSAKEISAISVSSQGITVVPVDRDLQPLCNALSWLDVRAEKQARRISEDFGDNSIFAVTGKRIGAGYTLPKLLWIKDNMPEIWDRAWKFLMPMDYLIAKLTGQCITDHSMASGTLFYDIRKCRWSKPILDYYSIPEEKLPEICYSGECVGKVLPEVAKALGLSENCIVAVGAQDQKCAAQAAGIKDGMLTVSLGTAAAVTKLWKEVKTEDCTGVGWCGYTCPGEWVTEGVVSTAGTCLRWVRDTVFCGESYGEIDREAAQAIERGSTLMFYPRLDETAHFSGVNLSTVRGDFAAAVMEGVAFEIRGILAKMQAYKDENKVILFGGGSKGDLWCQIISDVTEKEIYVLSTSEAAGAGAAMLAARALGKEMMPLLIEKSYTPKRDYRDKYLKYREMEKRLGI